MASQWERTWKAREEARRCAEAENGRAAADSSLDFIVINIRRLGFYIEPSGSQLDPFP